jgi:hypothetical protein
MTSNTQKPGIPLVARAIFGARGTGYTHLPKYDMRPHAITDRVDRHTDHYLGGQFVYRDTDTRYETRYEDRMTHVGFDQLEHETSHLVFEYPENSPMEVEKPWWGHKSDLVYVASHRGVGSYVYDLHSSDGKHVTEIHRDVVPPVRLVWPFLAGCVTLWVQTSVLHLSWSWRPALIVAGGLMLLIGAHRAWRSAMLALSRRRARGIISRLVRKDDAFEIGKAIRNRVSGWD